VTLATAKKWQKMCNIHIFLSQELLSLTENKRLRSKQQSFSRDVMRHLENLR